MRVAPVTAAAVLVVAGCLDPVEVVDPADLIFRGGPIQTMDGSRRRVEAVAVRDGRIVYVGPADGVERLRGRDTEVVELDGRLVLPGFHDTHVHPVSGGIELGECDLNAAETRADVVRIVTACARRAPEGAWIRGGGFQLPLFPDGAPTRALLDTLVGDRPAYLTSADGHSAWVSSRALAIAGVTAATADPPPDGVIVRDARGRPQGTLRERAMDLVAAHLPAHTDVEIERGLRRGLELAASLGITTVHEARASAGYARAYAAAEREGWLHARVVIALTVDPARGVDQIADLVAIRDRYAGRLARPVAAKIFLDGVIESHTAALLAPYEDRPGWRGRLTIEPERLDALVAGLDDAGFSIHVHAIGDRAVRTALDAFEARRARDGGAGPRHIIAHLELFDPDDIPRFAAIGVAASFQPLWLYADHYITDLTEPRLGPARSRWLYPLRSVADTGALVVAGSDWSVSSMDPLRAIEVALTRRDPDLGPGPAWIPDERVDLDLMLEAYTRNAAIAGDLIDATGSIEVGKAADLVVLDTDLYAIAAERISAVTVDMTVFEGAVVFRR